MTSQTTSASSRPRIFGSWRKRGIIGEHAEKDVRAHPIGEPVVDGPDVKIDRLDAAEGALHLAERLVATHGCRVVHHAGRQAGTHYIYAIGGGFGGDLGRLAREGEAVIGDGEMEVLAHLVLLDHGADGERDLGRPAQW